MVAPRPGAAPFMLLPQKEQKAMVAGMRLSHFGHATRSAAAAAGAGAGAGAGAAGAAAGLAPVLTWPVAGRAVWAVGGRAAGARAAGGSGTAVAWGTVAGAGAGAAAAAAGASGLPQSRQNLNEESFSRPHWEHLIMGITSLA